MLKWPNDLLLDGRKVAGILAQRSATTGAVVVGLGFNIGWAPDGAARLGDGIGVARVLYETLVAFDALGVDVAERYRRDLATLGADVRVELPDGTVLDGRATDVDDDGRLIVADAGRNGSPPRRRRRGARPARRLSSADRAERSPLRPTSRTRCHGAAGDATSLGAHECRALDADAPAPAPEFGLHRRAPRRDRRGGGRGRRDQRGQLADVQTCSGSRGSRTCSRPRTARRSTTC